MNKTFKTAATKYYVTCTDSFLSYWGEADNRKNKLVLECDTYEEAKIVAQNAKSRGDMKHVRIRSTKPDPEQYVNSLVQFKTKEDYPTWYKKGAF